jgi:hypothetical protein
VASLWLHEGVNPVQVAAWLGHKPSMTLDTYAHVIAELDENDRKPAEEVIEAARQDTSRTHKGVNAGSSQARRKRRKARSRAKSAASA